MKPRSDPRCAVDTRIRLAGPDGRRYVGEITDRGLAQIAAHAGDKSGRNEIGQFAYRVEAMRAISWVLG